ncbi:HEL101Cp [Eremothecium sinecaudum]|uniref:Spindle pole body component n=1 Tax=Eremothecium sinecaudum TaxID=45286 RepID=A0A0X8HTG8_9SACH|nr:HEL101Cp [Eremothecium sinecaudum]AMD21179.1 HEL101Cp [Eremothecium sinecaudum]
MEAKNTRDIVCLLPHGGDNDSFFSRLSNYQPITHTELKVKSYPLDQIVNQSVQESLVIRDLLHVLVGYEGVYIRYNNSYDPTKRDNGTMLYDIIGPDFKIAKNMDPSLKSVAKRISKTGRLYVILSEFISRFELTKFGTVIHRLCSVIREFIQDEYLPFIVGRMERSFREDTCFGIQIMEQMLNEEIVYRARLLYELVVNVMKEMERRDKMDLAKADFDNFMQDLKMGGENGSSDDSSVNGMLVTDTRVSPVAKGGVVLQILLEKLRKNWGDHRNLQFLRHVWTKVSEPYCEMLNAWLVKGELNDPYGEFLISNTSTDGNIALNSINSERLWDTQYVIRKEGLTEQFQDRQLQYKVLMTGKLLNLFKQCCRSTALLPDVDEQEGVVKEIPEGTQLLVYLDKWYQRANNMCWELFQDGYQLPKALYQFHRHFMLYNNEDFQNKFFGRSMIELTRSKSKSIELRLQRTWQQYQRYCVTTGQDLVLQLTTLRLDPMSLADVIMQFEENDETETALPTNSIPAPTLFASSTAVTRNSLFQARNFTSLKDMLLRDLEAPPHSAGSLSDASGQTSPNTPKKPLHSIHHLQFDIIIPFPLNTLISKPFVVEYQIVQRHLLLLLYYNHLLEDTWFETNKVWPARPQSPIRGTLKRARVLHNYLAQLLKALYEYTAYDVIDPDWRRLTSVIHGKPVPFARLQLALHDYLASVMASNLLTDTHLHRLVLQILEITHRFCKFISALRPTVTETVPDRPENIRYISTVSESLRDHVRALVEGIRHHNQRGHTTPRVLLLVERLLAFVQA